MRMTRSWAGVLHAIVAAVATLVVFRFLHDGRAIGGGGDQILRASGITALIWAYSGLTLGLLVAVRTPRPLLRRREATVAIHRQLNLAALALAATHLVSYAVLSPGGSWLVALVPQTADFGRLAYSAGVLAFYLALLLGPSWYLRARIGRRIWLVAHQLAALTYALALWHALVLGSTFRIDGPARTLLWILQVPLLALLAVRLYRPLRPADELDPGRRPIRFAGGRHMVMRSAIVLGIGVSGFGVLYVVLAALGPGLHA